MDGASEKNKEDELLVFGYACKLFRDDEKALFIDSGRHLIPWMADETLKIDRLCPLRYDGRGALSDLRPHEPPPGGYDRCHGFTDRERKLEQLVDEERYLALYKDEDEERMLEEEEWKRLQSLAGDSGRYNQIGFSYGSTPAGGGGSAGGAAPASAAVPAVDDEPYQPPSALGVPTDMAQPATRRHADIIERTALFVARQGPQMEILVKAKQSENAMFDFLAFDDPLQPFFRHVVVMIKAGRYTVGAQKQEEEEEEDESYLHPALNLSRPDIAPGRADGMYQPSANCAYQRLVKNIRSSRQAADSPAGSGTSSPVPTAAASTAGGGGERDPARAGSPAVAAARPKETESGAAPAGPGPVTVPPADVKLIIDKMASYVAKNGREFEGIVTGRGDERFSFLRDSHKHHAYYRQKLGQYERDLGKTKPGAAADATQTAEDKTNKPVPVSFSIRAKSEKESTPLERSALPLEESDDEGEEGGAPSSAAATAPAGAAEANGDTREQKAAPPAASAAPAAASRDPAKKSARQVPIVAPAPGVGRDEIQLDRKRRAAQFLAKLRQDVEKIKQPVIGPQLPPGCGGGDSDGGPEQPAAPAPAADTEGGGPPSSPSDGPPPHRHQPTDDEAQQQQQQQQQEEDEEEEEESGDDADLDKYKLVDSDSPHSVPELASDSGGSAARTRSDGERDSGAETGQRDAGGGQSSNSRERSLSKRSSRERSASRRRSRDHSLSKRRSRERSASKRSSRDRSLSKRRSRERSAGKRIGGGAREPRAASGERSGSRRRPSDRHEEHQRRHRHKKRSSHRRRRRRRPSGDERPPTRSRSRSRSRSPRRHKKRRKRTPSPPVSYKRLVSSKATAAAGEADWPRSARPDRSRSPARRKRKRSRSSRRHKHKSKKSKRSKRSRSRSGSRSAGRRRRRPAAPEVTEVTLSPGPAGDVIDLTGADSPDRQPESAATPPASGGGDEADPSVESVPEPAADHCAPAAAAGDSRASSTPRGASPTPVPSAAWSPAGVGSRSPSPRSSDSSRSGSPRSGGRPSDSGSEREDASPPVVLSRREEEARRTEEAIAQLKRKLVRHRPPPVATNGAAVRPTAAAAAGTSGASVAAGPAAADRSSSALVAQMAEGLKAKVHEMMKGSLLGK